MIELVETVAVSPQRRERRDLGPSPEAVPQVTDETKALLRCELLDIDGRQAKTGAVSDFEAEAAEGGLEPIRLGSPSPDWTLAPNPSPVDRLSDDRWQRGAGFRLVGESSELSTLSDDDRPSLQVSGDLT